MLFRSARNAEIHEFCRLPNYRVPGVTGCRNRPRAAARKDVERAFGILQAQFAIVRGPARFWDQEMLWYIMNAYVIMHNMIIENERGQDLDYTHYELMGHPVRVRRRAERVARFVASYHAIRRNETHTELQKDLIEEWWAWNGQQ